MSKLDSKVSAEIFKENYNEIKSAMSELKKNNIVSHKQIFDAFKKAGKCKTVDGYIKECEKQNITFRKRISLKTSNNIGKDFDVFYINGYFFLARSDDQIINPESIFFKHAIQLNGVYNEENNKLKAFLLYNHHYDNDSGFVEITENSFVYTDTRKDLSIDFTDYKKYIVREMDFLNNSITHQEFPNENIGNPNEIVFNNPTTKTNKEVNIDNSCPSFDCGLCSFFSSCYRGG